MQEKPSGPDAREGLPEIKQIRRSSLVGVGKRVRLVLLMG